MKPEIKFQGTLPFTIEKDNGWYIYTCDIINIITQGKTKKEAKDNLIDAISLFFIVCIEDGVIHEVIDGIFIKNRNKYNEISENNINFSIPMVPVKSNKEGILCQA